jgi:hypothetical protein
VSCAAWWRIGDSVILLAGAPFDMSGSANLIKLHDVPSEFPGIAGIAPMLMPHLGKSPNHLQTGASRIKGRS